MKKIHFVSVLCFILIFSQGFILNKEAFEFIHIRPAQKIELTGFKNLYKINDSLYRSEQPTKAGMKQLEILGIKTVLNFRNHHNDLDETKNTTLIVERLSLNTNKISQEYILTALKIIKNSKKPILIHCLHGSDRTGCVIAAYKMVYNNYSKQQAIAELREPQYGYHQKWFPNILELLNNLDVEILKRELK